MFAAVINPRTSSSEREAVFFAKSFSKFAFCSFETLVPHRELLDVPHKRTVDDLKVKG